jgi:aminoglycoside 2'-N-acetyltransferase I
MAQLKAAVHVMAWDGKDLVSHACWITRWLQANDGPLWRTAYVEAVATAAHARRRGLAAQVMRALVDAVDEDAQGYDIAALSPSDHRYYERLGWTRWQGPLFERKEEKLFASPEDEEAMIYRLPNTPEPDLTKPLSIEWRELEVW